MYVNHDIGKMSGENIINAVHVPGEERGSSKLRRSQIASNIFFSSQELGIVTAAKRGQ